MSVPAGWSAANTTRSKTYFDDWKPSGSTATQLALVSGRLAAGETFAEDLQAALQNFGTSAAPDTNVAVTLKGATQARELAGYGIDPDTGKKQYIDMVIAIKGKDTALLTAVTSTRAQMQAANLHTYLMSLAHA